MDYPIYNLYIMKIYRILFSILGLSVIYPLHSELRINELMQSNVTGIVDETKNFPDSWVELYNSGNEIEQLSDYKIGLKKSIDKAYQLPDSIIKPGQFVIIYCDKEETGLHTSFRLESNKEGSVFLFKNDKQLQKIDHPAFPGPDIAYGYFEESDNWGYELIQTPGEANTGGICEANHILGSPLFNIKGGVFDKPVEVSLSVPEDSPEGTQIRYTLNSDLPDSYSPVFEEGSSLIIDSSTIIRASLYCEGWLSSFAVTESYIFPDHSIDMHIVSIVTDNEYLTGREMGMIKNPYKEWRRPMNIELFEKDSSTPVINQLGEFRLHGNSAKDRPLKSFAVYANKRFGKNRFDYEFFPDMRPGIRDYKSILLRNSSNDFYECYMRDAVVQQVVGNNMELDYQAANVCAIYINGVYKGILNIRERSNEDNIYSNYDGLEDIDMVENYNELKEGSFETFEEFHEFAMNGNYSAEEINKILDTQNFLDTHFTNIYFNNCDFPGNNTMFWKPAEESGRWRMILKDADYAMGLKMGYANGNPFDYPTLDWFYNPGYPGANSWGNKEKYTRIFRNLLEVPEIKEEFLNRTLVYFGDFLNKKNILEVIDKRYNAIAEEWAYHATLYEGEGRDGQIISQTSLSENVNYMSEWIAGRSSFFPKYFADFYSLGEMKELHVCQPDGFKTDMMINRIALKTGEFHGILPAVKTFSITGSLNDKSYTIKGWTIYVNPAYNFSENDILEENMDVLNPENIIYVKGKTLEYRFGDADCLVIVPDVGILPESIAFTTDHLSLKVGEQHKLMVDFYPEEAVGDNLIFTSSNENVAIVSEEGIVTALSGGSTVITAVYDNLSAECFITVLYESGIDGLLTAPDAIISVYSTQGILIKKDCRTEDLKSLPSGVYIIVSGNDKFKIFL